MGRYGYLDMPDDYTDIADWTVEATCTNCGQVVSDIRESCWEEDGKLMTDCMCSELPDEEPEWIEPEIHWDDLDRPYIPS